MSDLALVVLACVVGAAWAVGVVSFIRALSRAGRKK